MIRKSRSLPFFATVLPLLAVLLLGMRSRAAETNAAFTDVPSTARALAAQGERAFASGNLKASESFYAKALDACPGNTHFLVSLAATKTRLGKLDESKNLLRQALRSDLDNGTAWLLLGMNELEQQHDDEAFADLVQATLRDGRNPRAHNYLGIASGRKGWADVSEQELRKAVELDPGYADANFNLAVFYLGRTPPLLELSRRHYQRALDLGTPRDQAMESRLAPPASPAPEAP
jgi:tetratricopeptide (TPR) repeat protein